MTAINMRGAALGFAIVLLVGFYAVAWRNMPLYPDEVALRLQSARALVDGALRYSSFPICGVTGSPIGWPLVPSAYLLSAFDFASGWSMLRLVPALSLIAALAIVLTYVQRSGPHPASVLVLGACIGVAGSSLIMMRMEMFLVLAGATCLLAYLVLRARRNGVRDALALVGLAFAMLMAIVVHPQSIILLPLACLISGAFLVTTKSLATRCISVSVVLITAVAAYSVLNRLQFPCDGFPQVHESFSGRTIFGGPGLWANLTDAALWQERFDRYVGTFGFKAGYISNYLPDVVPASGWNATLVSGANAVGVWFVVGNIFCAVLITIVAGWRLLKIVLDTRFGLKDRFAQLVGAGAPYLFVFYASHLVYLLYDVEGNFYRAHYFNLVFAVGAAVGLSALSGWKRWALVPVGAMAAVLSVTSSGLALQYFDSEFQKGWQGPSISLVANDWSKISTTVNELAATCGVSDDQSDLVVDDWTFDALKQHHHLMPITYIAWGHALVEGNANFAEDIPDFGSAFIVKCDAFGDAVPKQAIEQDGFCCIDF